jgi:hypothetical protein
MMLRKQKAASKPPFPRTFGFVIADVSENGRERKTAAAADVPNLPCAATKPV